MTESRFRDTLIDSGFILGEAEDEEDLEGMAWLCGTRATIQGFECTVRLESGREGGWLALVDEIDDTFSSATADGLADDIRVSILD